MAIGRISEAENGYEETINRARNLALVDRSLSRVGRIFRRIVLPAPEAFLFSPPDGWKIDSYGPSFPGRTSSSVCLTLSHAMPEAPGKHNILKLALAWIGGSVNCITLPWLAGKFGMREDQTRALLLAAGLGEPDLKPFGTGKSAFGYGFTFWIKRGKLGDPWSLYAKRQDKRKPDELY